MEELKNLLDSQSGKVLRDFLERKIMEMNDLRSVKEWPTPEAHAIEFKAQVRAVESLREILSEIMTIQDETISKKDPKDNLHPYAEDGKEMQQV